MSVCTQRFHIRYQSVQGGMYAETARIVDAETGRVLAKDLPAMPEREGRCIGRFPGGSIEWLRAQEVSLAETLPGVRLQESLFEVISWRPVRVLVKRQGMGRLWFLNGLTREAGAES